MAKRKRSKHPSGQHGVAVLMVLACLAIIAPFTATFNYQARVDFQSAINLRDEVAARQVQRGAMSLSLLLFEIQRMVFNQRQFRDMMGTMDITQVAPYLMSVFGTRDGAEGLGALVGLNTSALQDLALFEGSFEYRVTAESGKININCMAVQAKADDADNPAGRVTETLEALMLPTLYDPFFEEEKADGQFYTRSDILIALADYIDDDRNAFDLVKLRSGSRQEDYRYQQLFDPYTPRNARLDSVDELQLVQGIDDDWMAAFGHELTVYGGCKVNLNFASAEQIALVIRHSVAADDKWKTEGENFLLMTLPLANWLMEQREYSLFSKLEDFKTMIAEPDQFLSPLAALSSVEQPQNLPRVPQGIEVRVKGGDREDGSRWGGLEDLATVAPETMYRVEVITEFGAVAKRVVGVYDMAYSRANSQGKGAWLYIREE
ncbi:MAG: general secretion pathway protein GspK [Nannocystaceae bacterium]|nr:general secretion pathway protein GspK [Nannocystaceae bacterium]